MHRLVIGHALTHWCDDSSRHIVLRGRYVCAWLWLRGVDQGQTSVWYFEHWMPDYAIFLDRALLWFHVVACLKNTLMSCLLSHSHKHMFMTCALEYDNNKRMSHFTW